MTFTVYLITQRSTGKQYVGVTIYTAQRRWVAHVSAATTGKRKRSSLGSEIARCGVDDFMVEPLRTTACREKADMLEQNYIRDLGCMYPAGFNLQSGGRGGFLISARTRERLRIAHLGRPQSQESIEKRAAKLRGKKRDPAMIERGAAKRRGQKRSAQFRQDCRERAQRSMTPERREQIKQQQIARWKDPKQREIYVLSAMQRMQRPNARAQALLGLEKGRALRYGRSWPK